MIQKQTKLILGALMALTLFLSLWGITTGMPSAAQTALVFRDAKTLAALTPAMKALREEVYGYYATIKGVDLRKYYEPDAGRVTVSLDNAQVSLEKRKIHALRSVLMQTRYPDEQKTWSALARLNPARGEFNVHMYQYGGLYLYSSAAAIKAASMLHVFTLTSQVEYYFTHPADLVAMYVTPRVWGTLVTVLGIPLMFLCARRMYGTKAALTAAVLYAVLPALSVESHNFKPYAFSLTFVLAMLLFTLRFLESFRTRDLALASVFAGLSAGALILNGVFILCPAAALLLAARERKLPAALYLMVPAGFALGLLVPNLNWLMTPGEVLSEMASQQRGWPFQFGLTRLFHHFFYAFHELFSVPLYVLVIAGLAYSLIRPGKAEIVMLAPAIPYYLFIANQFPGGSHYAVPLVPFAVLMAVRLATHVREKTFLGRAVPPALWLVAAFALANSVYYNLFVTASQRNLLAAGAWINENIPAGSTISTSRYPYFGFDGYPPFSLLDYRVNETDGSRYFIARDNDDPFPKTPEFTRDYRLEKTFTADVPVLGRVFRNDLYFMWNHDVRIFARQDHGQGEATE